MEYTNAKRLADKYARTAGEWCRILYTAEILIDWRDLYNYARVLKHDNKRGD